MSCDIDKYTVGRSYIKLIFYEDNIIFTIVICYINYLNIIYDGSVYVRMYVFVCTCVHMHACVCQP